MSIKKEFAKDTVIYGLGKGLKKFIGIFLLPFYTRALSVEEFGILSTVGTFTMFVSAFLNFGLDSATGFYFFQGKDEKEKGEILFTHFIIRIVSIVPPLLLSFLSAPIAKILFGSSDYTWIVFISIILVPVNLLMSEQSHIYRYHRKPWPYNIVTIIKSFTNIGVGISLVVILKWGVIGAQLASIISSSVVVIGSILLYTRKLYTYKFNWYWAKRMFRFGFPLIWAGLAAWIYNSSDRFFLLHYSNLTEIGYYSIGTTFSQPIQLLNMAIQMSFGVLFFKIYNEETDTVKPKSKEMAIESYTLFFIVAVFIASLLSIFSIELVNLITTPEYIMGALAIPFLTFSFIAAQTYQTMGPGITLAEKNWYYTLFTVITALVNIVLNFILIPKFGFIGAAGSTLFSFIVYVVAKVIIAHKYFPINYPFFKYIIVYLISLSFSIAIPLLILKLNYEISFIPKLAVLLFCSSLFFFLGLIKLNTIVSIIKNLSIKRH